MNASLQNLRGVSRLSTDAVIGVVDLVEALHRRLSPAQVLLGQAGEERTHGIAALVYKSIRGISRLSGGALDAALGAASGLLALIPDASTARSPLQEAARAVLNGVLGDHLADSANPLAITMRLHVHAGDIPSSSPPSDDKLAVFVHGLCLNDLHWQAQDCDYGAALARDLGYTPLYLHYNSGLHISVNGREFADQLESLVQARRTQLKELVLIGHSMGGPSFAVPANTAHKRATRGGDRRAKRSSSAHRITAHHWNAAARGSMDCSAAIHSSRRLRDSEKSAAPASPTCATATSSMPTGKAATASRARIRAWRRHCPTASSATPSPRPRAHAPEASPIACSATVWCRWRARWGGMRMRNARCAFHHHGNGSAIA